MTVATYNVYNRITGKPVILDRPAKACADALKYSYWTFMSYAQHGGCSTYRIVRTKLPVYGKLAIGEKIRITPEFLKTDQETRNQLVDGVICWVHPENRFFVVDFGGVREAFQMGDLHG